MNRSLRSTSVAVALFSLWAIAGCFNLDANLLDPGPTITEYKMAAFTGDVDFRLDSTYALPASHITVFTLQSQAPGESSSKKIYAAYLGDTSLIKSDTVILYTHGYSHHMDFYYPRAELLANVGGNQHYGVMMLDYRGYGLSDGKPTEAGLYADVYAAQAWLKSHGLTGERLIEYGFSLGCAPAAYVTANTQTLRPQKLILESPFASADNLVQDGAVLNMPGSFVTSLKLNNVAQIQNVRQPFCWIHGMSDQFLSIATNGEVVYKNYHGVYGEAHRISGADHGTIPQTWGFKNYTDTLYKFITRE